MSEWIHQENYKWKQQKVCFCALPYLEGKVKNQEEMDVKFYVGLDIFKSLGNYFGCLPLL